jgi:hypothetical protein
MYTVPINIQDRSVQSINSFPATDVGFFTYDLTDHYYFSDQYHIRVIAPDVDQIEIHFTDGKYGAGIPNTASFRPDFRTETEIAVSGRDMYVSINPTSVFIETIGEPSVEQEVPAEETHKISGNVTEDSKIIVLDSVSSELIKAQNVAAGSYTVTLPDTTVDVLAKAVDDGEPNAHTGVVTIPQ